MESRNKKEAIRARDIALGKMGSKDFTGARKLAAKAQKLCPDLDNVEQIILVCDVHCSVAEKDSKDEKDWYKILNVDPTADEALVRRHCNKMALSLHPDRNRCPGAADAFRWVLEAKAMLTDNERRRLYDSRCKAKALGEWGNWNGGFPRFQSSYKPSTNVWPNGGELKQNKLNKPRSSKKNVEGGDDEVEIVRVVKRSKCSGYSNIDAKEVNTKGKTTAPKSSENGGRVEGSKSSRDFRLQYRRKTRAAKEGGKHGAPVEDGANSGKTSQFAAGLASGMAPDSKILEYLDGEFNDFEKERGKKCLHVGQIWAVYDTLDAMPRFYALINKIISEDFKLEITWLEPLPNNDGEKNWLYQGLPASFGKFKLGHSETIEDHAIFSHLVSRKRSANFRNIYEIYPRKGETWALFKKWDIDWYRDPDRHKVYEFELVEILSDYYGKFGVTVAFLSKMEGFSSSFSRIMGKGLNEVIQVKDRFRFSHRIPSFTMTAKDGLNVVKSFFELDPASVPSNFSSSC